MRWSRLLLFCLVLTGESFSPVFGESLDERIGRIERTSPSEPESLVFDPGFLTES